MSTLEQMLFLTELKMGKRLGLKNIPLRILPEP
jgi:hypothetical protein